MRQGTGKGKASLFLFTMFILFLRYSVRDDIEKRDKKKQKRDIEMRDDEGDESGRFSPPFSLLFPSPLPSCVFSFRSLTRKVEEEEEKREGTGERDRMERRRNGR